MSTNFGADSATEHLSPNGSRSLSGLRCARCRRPGTVLPVFPLAIASILFSGQAHSADAVNRVLVKRKPLNSGTVQLSVVDKQDIRFVRGSLDGTSFQSPVVSMAQDNQGFLWLAGNGLHRYDGYSLRPYRHDPADPDSLSNDTVLAVVKDTAGFLWVGTAFGGLDRLDPMLGKFRHFRHDPGDSRTLIDDNVICIHPDRAGMLWIGTHGGLDRLDPKRGTFTHYRNNPRDESSLSNDEVSSLFEDQEGSLWVGTTFGLNKLDPGTGRVQRFVPERNADKTTLRNYVRSVRVDHAGVVWVATGGELRSLDITTGRFTQYYLRAGARGGNPITVIGIHEDPDGILWLGTMGNGLLKASRDRKEIVRYARDPGNPYSLHDRDVRPLLEDAEGTIWLGSLNGFTHFSRRPPAFVNYQHESGNPQSLRDNPILSVLEDSQGSLWIAGAGGLNRLDGKSGALTVYQHEAQNRHSLSSNTIYAIHEDRSGTVWFGTYGGGLDRFDRQAGRFLAYRFDPSRKDSLSSDLILSLLEDRQGTLWVGTQGGGLNRFDPKSGGFTSWRNDPNDPSSLSHNNVIAMLEDNAGFLWLGTLDGLSRFDPRTNQFAVYRHSRKDSHSLSHNKVNALWQDRKGTLWIGTEDGLNRLDRGAGTFASFTVKDGLPDNSIQAILEDPQGYLWLATYNGLSRFDPQKRIFRNYSESDGLSGSLFRTASCRTPAGELMFGSSNGLTVFDPGRLPSNLYVPPVVLTDLRLFNRPVQPDAHSPLPKPIWATSSLTLTHAQSIFTIEFAALSYAIPEKNRYRYRLEGFEPEWNEVDYRRRLATYSNLPPGNYTFRVQASNNDEIWNNTGASLAIQILPPWWATLWFKSFVGLSLSALIVLVYRSHMRNLRMQTSRLEVQVSERTRELRIAKDAAEGANRAKSAFLATVSHELRSPLNTILLLSHPEWTDAQKPHEAAEDLSVIRRSAEHLLHLIDDVLDSARIEAGQVVVEKSRLDLPDLIQEVGDLLRVRAEQKSLELLVEESSGLPRSILADGIKLRHILINLLENAVKYTDVGRVMLRVNSRTLDSAGQLLLSFEIADTGVGIALHDQARIFEPFSRVTNGCASKGAGLGLSIVRQYLNLMGGSIRLESLPDEGSRFFVDVPVDLAEESESARGGTNTLRVLGLAPGQPERRVLIVEDRAEDRSVMRRILEQAGFRVQVADTGESGIEMFQLWRPHFIWMDRRLPAMDGLNATRCIRTMEGGSDVKIAGISASVFVSEREEMLAAGLDEFIRKPYLPKEIFDCMERHLGVAYSYSESK